MYLARVQLQNAALTLVQGNSFSDRYYWSNVKDLIIDTFKMVIFS